MQTRHLKSDLLFLLSAIIWGFAFVAQRMGMDHVGPFTFNGIRFLLGAMVLVPFIYRNRDHRPRKQVGNNPLQLNRLMLYGGLAGLAIFAGAYVAEIVRGGLQSVPRGQIEAGQALVVTEVLVLRHGLPRETVRAVFSRFPRRGLTKILIDFTRIIVLEDGANTLVPIFLPKRRGQP